MQGLEDETRNVSLSTGVGFGLQPDVEAITELVSELSTGTEAQLLNIAAATLMVCWLIGIIDSYRLGRARDKKDEVLVNRQA